MVVRVTDWPDLDRVMLFGLDFVVLVVADTKTEQKPHSLSMYLFRTFAFCCFYYFSNGCNPRHMLCAMRVKRMTRMRVLHCGQQRCEERTLVKMDLHSILKWRKGRMTGLKRDISVV